MKIDLAWEYMFAFWAFHDIGFYFMIAALLASLVSHDLIIYNEFYMNSNKDA
jgi:hypothetical protein